MGGAREEKTYDVAVIGAGHAGCEAALASARLGKKTLLLTIGMEQIAHMPCNPSIGGTGKGQLVKEIDALGGEMGTLIDKTAIQSRMLNRSKGPAVWSPRAQADKERYHAEMRKTLEQQPGLDLRVGEVERLLYDGLPKRGRRMEPDGGSDEGRRTESDDGWRMSPDGGSGGGRRMEPDGVPDGNPSEGRRIYGVRLRDGTVYEAAAVILATGTYLGSRVFVSDRSSDSGPSGFAAATALSKTMREDGFELRRFKTGTPARALAGSLDYEKMTEQRGDETPVPFSYLNDEVSNDNISCWLTYTNPDLHRLVYENLDKTAPYGGYTTGVGTRYCLSIEDKVSRFPDRVRHQLFLEPEGLETNEVYIQGMSTSLPEELQERMYRMISGLEEAEFSRYAYSIEYDCLDPLALTPALEYKGIKGLFCAGQINGTSGYEEAAAQGLIAGINAARALDGKPPFLLERSEAYIGVLIDDLVTKGTNEPYRIMTSRAEFRLVLRQDNADLRLTQKGYELGLATKERYERYLAKKRASRDEVARLKSTKVSAESANRLLLPLGSAPVSGSVSLAELLTRPEVDYKSLEIIDGERPEMGAAAREQAEIEIKYAGYIEKQRQQIEKFERLEQKRLPAEIDYGSLEGLRLEARQKLSQIRPVSLGQAARISGVSPADISVLMVYLTKGGL